MAVTTVGGAETAVHRGLIGKQGMGSSFPAMAASFPACSTLARLRGRRSGANSDREEERDLKHMRLSPAMVCRIHPHDLQNAGFTVITG